MIFGIFLLLIFPSLTHAFTNKSFLTYRSQGSYYMPRNFGSFDMLHNNFFGNCEMSVAYGQSFDADAINKYLFGSNRLVFSGSAYPTRSGNDIMADYFGLPTDFKSSVRFFPKVENVATNITFSWSLDRIKEGLFFQINLPFAYSNWKLNPCETIIDPGTLSYPAGYMSDSLIAHADLKKGALDVLQRQQTFGDLTIPLHYGRLTKARHTTKCADITSTLGYVFKRKKHSFGAVNVLVVIPTGTRSHGINLFEPQVGNGHHWALGGELSGNYAFLNEEDRCLSILFKAQLQHLFKTKQKRSYDLNKNGRGSRYVLLQDMVDNIAPTQGFSADFQPSPSIDKQYLKRLLYTIDATTLDSKIQIDVEANIVAALKTEYKRWNAHIGYNLWARSHEKLITREKLKHHSYGVKGDAQIYGFFNLGPFLVPLPMNATQSQSTIFAGQGESSNTTNNYVNNNADNAALAYNAGAPLTQTDLISALSETGITTLEQINGSNQAIIITDSDINNCSGLSPAALTHTLFGEIGYSWDTQKERETYLSIGASAEYAATIDCLKGSISQWNGWIKLGMNY